MTATAPSLLTSSGALKRQQQAQAGDHRHGGSAYALVGCCGPSSRGFAGEAGEPAYASLHRLLRTPPRLAVTGRPVHVCENPNLLAIAGITPPTAFLLAKSYDGYDTNIPVADVTGGKGMIATRYAGAPLAAEHGGPARLLVPHLYFWKSAKWVKALRFTARDEAGFWELRGYHMYGDPWREQRYSSDP